MILVTGATGFVGRQVVRCLGERECSLRIPTRNIDSVPAEDAFANSELWKTADLFSESPERLRQLLDGVDTIVHAAWYTEHGKYLDSPINLDCLAGTLRLAQVFVNLGGTRFVGIGTCLEYDLSVGRLSTGTPLKPHTLYGRCKASTYQVLAQFLPSASVELAWCRLFYLYGEGEDPRRLVPYLHRQLAAGERAVLGSPDRARDYLDVREAGAMIAEVALGRLVGPVNICSGQPTTIQTLADNIASQYGRHDLLQFDQRSEDPMDPRDIIGVPGPAIFMGP